MKSVSQNPRPTYSHFVDRIIPVTAHAAFDKASAYFKIKLHWIAVDPVTRQVDLKQVRRAM